MRQADRRSESDIPWRLEKRTVLAHDARWIRIVRVRGQTSAHIVIHAEAVAHLVSSDVAVEGRCQADLSPSIGASVDPERRSARGTPIGTGRCAIFGPVVRVHSNLTVESRERVVASFFRSPYRCIDQGRPADTSGIDPWNIDLDPVKDPASSDVHRAERDIVPVLHEST